MILIIKKEEKKQELLKKYKYDKINNEIEKN